MPDQGSAADEHAILQEITAPLASLPEDPLMLVGDVDFPRVRRGYDPLAVDAYVRRTTQLVAELQSKHSPDAAVRRALERVGEQISGILQRAHETAEQITTQSRREAEDRLQRAREEARAMAVAGEQRIKDLDADTDRIWAERLRIIEDARELAAQLIALADTAAERFPPADDTTGSGAALVPGPAAPVAEEPVPDEPLPEEPLPEEPDPDATALLPRLESEPEAPGDAVPDEDYGGEPHPAPEPDDDDDVSESDPQTRPDEPPADV
jgi:hypothetical protein